MTESIQCSEEEKKVYQYQVLFWTYIREDWKMFRPYWSEYAVNTLLLRKVATFWGLQTAVNDACGETCQVKRARSLKRYRVINIRICMLMAVY